MRRNVVVESANAVLGSASRIPARREYFRRRFGRTARALDAKTLVDTFLVFTVATIIVIRVFLEILGYPQLGGDGLHVAHLLWGGALLVVGLVVATVFITRAARWIALMIGGIGFGLFIDEIGKFVTSDNNYFFKPTFGLIYFALVLIWLLTRTLLLRRPSHPREALANALDLLKEASVRELNEEELRAGHELLDKCDGSDPFVQRVRMLLDDIRPIPKPRPFVGTRLVTRTKTTYGRLATTRVARIVVALIFAALAAVALISIASLAYDLVGEKTFEFIDWASLASNCVLAVFYLVGIYSLFRRDRLTAYRWFEGAVLFNIFVVQVFDFADYGPIAAVELVISLLLLVTLHLMIAEEEHYREGPRNPLTAVLARAGLAPAER